LLALVLGLVAGGTGLAVLAGSTGADAPDTLAVVAAQDKPTPPLTDASGDDLSHGAAAPPGSARLPAGDAPLAPTRDGRTIVPVAPQGVVRPFDAQPGRPLQRRQITDRRDTDPTGQAMAQLSADGKTAVINDRQITVWDVPSGKMTFRPPAVKGQT